MSRRTYIELADDDDQTIVFDAPYAFNTLIKEVGGTWNKSNTRWEIPASWAACVRARGVFGDTLRVGPRLIEWAKKQRDSIENQNAIRDLVVPRSTIGYDPRLYPHQMAGADFLVNSTSALLADQPGVGKTATLLTALSKTTATPAIVICPASIKENWRREAEMWAPHVNPYVVGGGAATRAKILAEAAEDPKALVIINFESVRSHSRLAPYGSVALTSCDECTPGGTPNLAASKCEKHPKELNKIPFETVIIDECVPHDTGIRTPTGYKPISELRPGDPVIGINHKNGLPTVTHVVRVARSPLRPLHQIDDLKISGNHPIWQTDEGLSCYDADYGQHTKESTRENMRAVQNPVHGEKEAPEILHKIMRVNLSLRKPTRVTRPSISDYAGNSFSSRRTEEVAGSSDRSNATVQEPTGKAEIRGDQPETGMVRLDGRKWYGTYRTTEDATGFLTELDTRVSGEGLGKDTELSDLLQVGSRISSFEIGHRDSWSITQSQESSREGSQEETFSGVTWLEDSVSDEFGDPDQSLWNIETGTGNYFANGILVHNCHRLKDPKSKQTRAVWGVAHADTLRYRWAATGTPIANNPGDLWAILRAISPLSFPTKTKFIDRYCLIEHNPFGGITIMGLKPDTTKEFFSIFDPMFRRMTKERVLENLPPKVRSIRFAEMSPKQKKAYKEMESGFTAQLGDDWVTANDHLTAAGRLVQLSSSFAEITKPDESPDDPSTWTVKLTEPSNKVDAFMEIVEDFGPDYPLVACAESRQLIELTSARLTKQGIPHVLITGTQTQEQRTKALDDFQGGRVNILLFTIKAGGVGLTMTRADTIVFLQRSWSMVDNLQAADRIHRVGSERHESVHIIDVVAPDTIELHQINRVHEKIEMAQEIVRD